MKEIQVKIGRESFLISEEIFRSLLDIPFVKDSSLFKKAITSKQINISDLKKIAAKAFVPYPLFFAESNIVKGQIESLQKSIFEKIPSKHEMQLNFRGGFLIPEIELIVLDLGRKQEFLKKRILINTPDNPFIGFAAPKFKSNFPVEMIAADIRDYFGIDLDILRRKSKDNVLKYLVEKIEQNNILVSFSSHNFMPQNLKKDLMLSGICIKDKKFPYIFINTRDGDASPKIFETSGRQVFTLLTMLVFIAINKFVFSTKSKQSKNNDVKRAYSIASEIILPRNDLADLQISNLSDVKKYAAIFKVTPSMLIFKLLDLNLIKGGLANAMRHTLKEELRFIEQGPKFSPLPTTGYRKYNGEKFSHEIIGALNQGKISVNEAKNILFRRNKMDTTIFQGYKTIFG